MTDARYVAHCNTGVSPPTVGVQYIPATPPPTPPNTAWLYRNGVRAVGRPFTGTPVAFDYLAPGTYTLKIYTDSDVFISESAPFTVPDTVAATPTTVPTPTSTPTLAAPGQVTGLTVGTPTSSSLPLTWTAPGTGGAVSAYTVEHRATGSTAWTTDTTSDTATAYVVAGLAAATGYDVRVTATNASGAGTPSAVASGTTAAAATPAPTPAPAPAETGTLSGVPTSGTAGTALAAGGTFSLANAPNSGTTAYVGLLNVTAGAYQGALQAVTGSSGSLPTLTPASAAGAATYAVRLCADSAGATVLATSPNIAVAAAAAAPAPAPTPAPTPSGGTIAPDGTLSGLPSTIVAGQPLSAATYGQPQSTPYFVLYRVAGAVEEGVRWASSVMPGNLTLLIPQTAGAYTVRGYDAATAGNKVYESAQFNVTAAAGALPATPTQAADTGTTSSATTMNWSATAPSYRVLARPGVGTVYGSLADTTVSTNSYTFTGLAPSSSPRAVIIPQNANGYGTPSGQFLSFITA